VYDGDNILLQYNGSDVLTHRYSHGEAVDQAFSDENLLDSSKNLFTLPDHESSIRDLAFVTAGALAKHINFDSFGRILPGGSNPGGVDELHGFTGRQFDPETGLQYNRARYYSPDLGRFISQDPAGFAAGDANLYRYVGNSPLMLIDPSGLGSTSYTNAVVSSAVNAFSSALSAAGDVFSSISNAFVGALDSIEHLHAIAPQIQLATPLAPFLSPAPDASRLRAARDRVDSALGERFGFDQFVYAAALVESAGQRSTHSARGNIFDRFACCPRN
jgi:RHS repeat-associated protein